MSTIQITGLILFNKVIVSTIGTGSNVFRLLVLFLGINAVVWFTSVIDLFLFDYHVVLSIHFL